ncbi:MAG: Pr6Pr family membrane protein [Eubacterium sp.]
MYIKNLHLTLIYRIVFLILCGYGLSMHLSLDDVEENIHMISYFTVQSNMLCFFVFFVLVLQAIFHIPPGRITYIMKGLVTLAILITFLSFHFVIAKYDFINFSIYSFNVAPKDLFAHYIVPIMVVSDWLLFQPKGNFMPKDPFYWLIFPLVYCVVTMFRSSAGLCGTFVGNSKYPYFFLDIEDLGVLKFITFIVLYTVFILFAGYIIVVLDHAFDGWKSHK